MTVAELREALDGVPDDMEVTGLFETQGHLESVLLARVVEGDFHTGWAVFDPDNTAHEKPHSVFLIANWLPDDIS